MEILTEQNAGLQNSESKKSSETLVALSILHLIRFFDTFDPKNESSPEYLSSETETEESKEPEGPLDQDTKEPQEQIQQSKESNSEQISETEKVADSEQTVETKIEKTEQEGGSINNENCEVNEENDKNNQPIALLTENFRPRSPVNPTSGLSKSKNSRSFSLGTFQARQWIKRSASVFFPELRAREKEGNQHDDKAYNKNRRNENNNQILPSHFHHSSTETQAKRISSTLFTRKHNSETELENMVFLPKTHRPLPQNYPTVEDVEDIAEARTEYSVLPDEWSGYMEPMMKSSGCSAKPKNRWERWNFPTFKKRLQKKLRSSLASGARKTRTLRVRFFPPPTEESPQGDTETSNEKNDIGK
ncbi:CIC11C00000000430 [Sungouiella intermedia]|uniref:CIC11C00000000430 n=1 Tax=Sungouiella intermedia TaxID=45354 RepID=A0A1L0FXR6_9ASCO|nr:CIC11C00000000430 [[Candida] intermedia]